MKKDDKKGYAVELLRERYELLGRLPKRSDFESNEVCLIKQQLGPWPRALETAGLKQTSKLVSAKKNRMKHKLARQNKKSAKLKEDVFSVKTEEDTK